MAPLRERFPHLSISLIRARRLRVQTPTVRTESQRLQLLNNIQHHVTNTFLTVNNILQSVPHSLYVTKIPNKIKPYRQPILVIQGNKISVTKTLNATSKSMQQVLNNIYYARVINICSETNSKRLLTILRVDVKRRRTEY